MKVCTLFFLAWLISVIQTQAGKPNVLFIAIDDLNHWVGHLGRNEQALTPNIDRLAKRGVSFSRAYCAAPACNPSRAALMSGMRPSTTGVYHNPDDWETVIPEDKTMGAFFKKNGYHVAGAGKIYHGGLGRASDWDEMVLKRDLKYVTKAEGPEKETSINGLKFRQLSSGDESMPDHHFVSWINQRIAKKHDKPFFLACGIFRPHLPWNVPEKYFDLHPLDDIKLPPFAYDDLEDVPISGKKMARPGGDHAAVEESGKWKELVQAYLAAISFADAQVGRLMEALDKGPNAENTIVALWGDHGWHLGEKSHWRKFSLWEEGTRAPLIWVAPGVTRKGSILRNPSRFHEHLSDACRPLWTADTKPSGRGEPQTFVGRSQGLLGPTCYHDAWV